MTTKPAKKLTLKDKLSRLSYAQAVKLLRTQGEQLLRQGGLYAIDLESQVDLDDQRFHLSLPEAELEIFLDDKGPGRLRWQCSCRRQICDHLAAAFALILEEKSSLGLAKPPPEHFPAAAIDDQTLIDIALEERRARANQEKMRVKSLAPTILWTDYLVTNPASGKTYRVALRGWETGESYCSCPDFRKNTLGTCKHILHTLTKVKRRFNTRARKQAYQQRNIALHLLYGETLELRLLLPTDLSPSLRKIIDPIRDKVICDMHHLLQQLQRLQRAGEDVLVYPDADEYIQSRLFQERIAASVAEIRRDPANHVLRHELLKVPLLPYQLDGIAFAAGAGRAILADDMGLGKTIQGIGLAEMLAQDTDIHRVLVITPASLKSQWHGEIQRFCERDCQIILGNAEQRAVQYQQTVFFTLCNYEQVLRDITIIEQQPWDLIILDEGQRIKNWEAKTSQTIKSLRSPFALVLSGTPLENRLDDLYSIMEFIDDRRLGPGFRFYHRHRVVDEKGKVIGYKNMGELRKQLAPVLLRRTRASVLQELPQRTTDIIRIRPTQEQLDIHSGHRSTISAILSKHFLTEMDLLRLQKALLMCRMVANSTYLVDKQAPGYSSKLDELTDLLDMLFREADRKIVLFSEWTTMLDIIEPLIKQHQVDYVRLDGKVPQKKRQQLVRRFRIDPSCRVFLTTNAGSTGLNLQAANTVINVDLPWNPALLEQRIARAHRMGQDRPVHVYILVTEETLEEGLLATLSAKKELAIAALDPDTDIDQVDLTTGIDELKRRLEVLIGATPERPTDESMRQELAQTSQRQQNIAAAGGQLVTAAFRFLDEMLPDADKDPHTRQLGEKMAQRLSDCLQPGPDGGLQLSINLPDKAAVTAIANTLARVLTITKKGDR